MNIQSNVNQMLSLASLLGSQTPLAEEQRQKVREKQASERYSKILSREKEAGEQRLKSSQLEPESTQLEIKSEIQGGISNTAKSAYLETGSPEFLNEYGKYTFFTSVNNRKVARAKAAESAEAELKAKQEEKRSSRRNFLDYMKDEPVYAGGDTSKPFGSLRQLSPEIQKAYAAKFKKSEKTKIMDEKDAMNE